VAGKAALDHLRFAGSYQLLKLARTLANAIFAVDTSECSRVVKFRGIVRPRWYSAVLAQHEVHFSNHKACVCTMKML
jgi:hypothetical protein